MLRVAAADDDCDEVQLGEMIDAMADALMEVQVQPTIINVPDLKPTLPPRTKKPPKGVFYKDSIRFAPKAPLPVLRQRCTCRYLCHGGRAEIKCLSCALYEPSGVSYYCRMCFDARHPWHRVAHVFTTIYQDELIGINMKLQREAIETDRYLQEGHLLKEKVAKNLAAIELVADDVAAENNMRVIGRKIAGIEGRLRDMRSGFRHGLAAEGAPLRFTDEDGIALLQRVYRGFRIRRVISLLYAERVVRVWDAAVGRDFYYDRKTQSSSWTPPIGLLAMDMHRLPAMELDEDGNTRPKHCWPCKRIKRRKMKIKIKEKNRASEVVTGFFRCVRARSRVLQTARQVFARVWDQDYERHFYSNLRTGESSWEKPSVFLGQEAPLLLTEGQSRRSPRVNREPLLITGATISFDELSQLSK